MTTASHFGDGRKAAREDLIMFIQDFRIVDRPFKDFAEAVESAGGTLLGEALDLTRKEGERLQARVAPATWPSALAKTVTIEPGPVRRFGDGILVAFSWEARGAESLMPRLYADLEVAPFGADQAALELRGWYEPPARFFGRMADKLLLHRLAESTVRAFLESVCDAVTIRSTAR
jgi:hypothetical protein